MGEGTIGGRVAADNKPEALKRLVANGKARGYVLYGNILLDIVRARLLA